MHDQNNISYNVGRSNAINIAERLGLPDLILDDARGRYGPASVEINEVTCLTMRVGKYLSKIYYKIETNIINFPEILSGLIAEVYVT